MMEEFLVFLANRSIQALWLIPMVLMLRVVLKRMPKWIVCLLWGVVALELVLPFEIESEYALLGRRNGGEWISEVSDRIWAEKAGEDRAASEDQLSPRDAFPESDRDGADRGLTGTGAGMEYRTGNENGDADHQPGMNITQTEYSLRDRAFGQEKERNEGQWMDETSVEIGKSRSDDRWRSGSPGELLPGLIWGIGAGMMLLYAIFSRLKIKHLVREAIWFRDNLFLCDGIGSPFILGCIRPRIYLPAGQEEKEDMKYVIAHEQAHLKRGDHFWKVIGYGILVLYWFHPMVWASWLLLCRDIELACDERVIKNYSMSEKKAYSGALLSFHVSGRKRIVCPLAFGEVGVKERVRNVLRYKKPSALLAAVGVAVCLVTAGCAMTKAPEYEKIRITIPAGSGADEIAYSGTEICPQGGVLKIYEAERFGDAGIRLVPVEAKEDREYHDNYYITPGLTTEIDVEQGAWFRIGVMMGNPSDEDMEIVLMVRNIETREASGTGNEAEDGGAPRESGMGKKAGDGGGNPQDGSRDAGTGQGEDAWQISISMEMIAAALEDYQLTLSWNPNEVILTDKERVEEVYQTYSLLGYIPLTLSQKEFTDAHRRREKAVFDPARIRCETRDGGMPQRIYVGVKYEKAADAGFPDVLGEIRFDVIRDEIKAGSESSSESEATSGEIKLANPVIYNADGVRCEPAIIRKYLADEAYVLDTAWELHEMLRGLDYRPMSQEQIPDYLIYLDGDGAYSVCLPTSSVFSPDGQEADLEEAEFAGLLYLMGLDEETEFTDISFQIQNEWIIRSVGENEEIPESRFEPDSAWRIAEAGEDGTMEVLVYITNYSGSPDGGGEIVFDEIEWVKAPGERADELGITHAPNGFAIYNESQTRERCRVSKECAYEILAPGLAIIEKVSWVNYMRYWWKLSPGKLLDAYPFILTIKDHEVVRIRQCYVP